MKTTPLSYRMNFKSLSLLLIIIAFFSCKKETNEEEIFVSVCDESTFSRILDQRLDEYKLVEDGISNIILYGLDHAGIATIRKYDQAGNFLWEKNIPEITGKIQACIVDKSNNIFISSATYYTQNTGPYPAFNGWIHAADDYDVTNNVWENIYTQGQISEYGYSIEGQTFVSKISSSGNYLWTQEFEGNYFNGKNICLDQNDNLLVLTIDQYGLIPEPVYKDSVYQDTVNYPRDRNSLTITNLSTSGTRNWETTIDDIYFKGTGQLINNLNIVSLKEGIIANTEHGLIRISNSGEYQDMIYPPSGRVANRIYDIKRHENGNLFIAAWDYQDAIDQNTNPQNIKGYVAKVDDNFNITWKNESSMRDLLALNQSVITHNHYFVQIYDLSGNQIHEVGKYERFLQLSPNCFGGYTELKTIGFDSSNTILTRYNSNFEF